MLHLKQLSSPFSLFVLCVVFFFRFGSIFLGTPVSAVFKSCILLGLSELESVYLVKFF